VDVCPHLRHLVDGNNFDLICLTANEAVPVCTISNTISSVISTAAYTACHG